LEILIFIKMNILSMQVKDRLYIHSNSADNNIITMMKC
jgi:hypothetical protein